MRVFSVPQSSPSVQGMPAAARQPQPTATFFPFGADAFARARAQHVPVFLLIGDHPEALLDPSVSLQLAERTVPVQLRPGERPDVELLCQRAGVLFSGEGALPLCALMTEDAMPFLAAPLPPPGFPLDPSRLYVWLSQADRRYQQNPPACTAQASQVIRSFSSASAGKPYSPQDAAHHLSRALLAIEDGQSGGFGGIKTPFVCGLRFAQHAGTRGDKALGSAFSRAMDAMLASALHDPLDGSFFRATLTDDWRVFVPEKPLGVNALLALCLMTGGRRSEAVHTLDALVSAFSLSGGGLSPAIYAPRETYAFTSEQACAALGSENGLRACRLLSLLRQQTQREPEVIPSRFSPVADPTTTKQRRAQRLDDPSPARYPTLPDALTPEDAAFLRRAAPALLRARAARTPQQPRPYVITEHCALAAAVLAACGRRLGEARYTQAAQRAVSFLISQPPAGHGITPLPASAYPSSPIHAQATCGASAALALAQLTLGQSEGMEEYAQSGLRLLSAALHAFVREDGLVMHAPRDPAAFFPRVPAIYDSELPSPAATLVRCLRIADQLYQQGHYADAIAAIWEAAASGVRAQPLACAGLIDAMTEE
ncbi:MAG: DUF255 domain-containing protein [Clostridiales bacterium]|nr:DUF255 domain-containing protein [Clostridiales bacterium]